MLTMIVLAATAIAASPVPAPPFEKGTWEKSLLLRPSANVKKDGVHEDIVHDVTVCHFAPPPPDDGLFFMPAMHRYCTAKSANVGGGQASFSATCRLSGDRTLEVEGHGTYSATKYRLTVTGAISNGGENIPYTGAAYGRRTVSCSDK